MATIHVFIKKDYLDKKGEAPVLVEYHHQLTRKRFKPNIKVNPNTIGVIYDSDTELFKVYPLNPPLQDETKKKLIAANTSLQSMQIKIKSVIEDFTKKKQSLAASQVEREYYKATKAENVEQQTKEQRTYMPTKSRCLTGTKSLLRPKKLRSVKG